ncbi:MAG TPA: cell wall-binding repeat-containing protein [Intrasporangiaceae bacterium]|nr:cell wall-binding repeat-containing protein [Intrasporangiaceae bacterium]
MKFKHVLVAGVASAMLLGGSLSATAASEERIGGVDRYATSAAISQKAFPQPVFIDRVFLASGEAFPDALVAGAAAGSLKVPVLLTRRAGIPDVIEKELTRLKPSQIVIVGGQGAISKTVADRAASWGTVSRWAGANRYATAKAVAEEIDKLLGSTSVAFLASGTDFPDALGGGFAGATVSAPLLLTDPQGLSSEAADYLQAVKPKEIFILGGKGAVEGSVVSAAAQIAPVRRIAGSDRYGTSAAISRSIFDKPEAVGTVVLANGLGFPDALSGTPLAAVRDAPILLVNLTGVPPVVCREINRLDPDAIVVLGGKGAISDAVIGQAQRCAVTPPKPPRPSPTGTPGPGPTTPVPTPSPSSS